MAVSCPTMLEAWAPLQTYCRERQEGRKQKQYQSNFHKSGRDLRTTEVSNSVYFTDVGEYNSPKYLRLLHVSGQSDSF